MFNYYSMKTEEQKSPLQVEALIRRGADWCSEGIVSNTAITISVPCIPQNNTIHLGFSGMEPCLPSKDFTLSVTRKPRVGFWTGGTCVDPVSQVCSSAKMVLLIVGN